MGHLQVTAQLAAGLMQVVKVDPNALSPLVRMLLTSLTVEGVQDFQAKAIGRHIPCTGLPCRIVVSRVPLLLITLLLMQQYWLCIMCCCCVLAAAIGCQVISVTTDQSTA